MLGNPLFNPETVLNGFAEFCASWDEDDTEETEKVPRRVARIWPDLCKRTNLRELQFRVFPERLLLDGLPPNLKKLHSFTVWPCMQRDEWRQLLLGKERLRAGVDIWIPDPVGEVDVFRAIHEEIMRVTRRAAANGATSVAEIEQTLRETSKPSSPAPGAGLPPEILEHVARYLYRPRDLHHQLAKASRKTYATRLPLLLETLNLWDFLTGPWNSTGEEFQRDAAEQASLCCSM
ncbi:hypothetical protein DFJ74DRAFT_703439 [Hyaloraphidium curvatum]|nr:hypothetical protein DFJ74DRAFT_703439 [Hyaloraphidium curvatum]